MENNKKREELELQEIKSGDDENLNKKSMSTQVDHIALIIAHDPIHRDLFKNEELMDLESQKLTSSKRKQKKQQQKEIEEKLKQIGGEQQTKVNNGLPNKVKRNRRRLDSAPSFDNGSDGDYNDDVNYTLSGYLHTIHSFRQYALTHRQPHLPTVLSNNTVSIGTTQSKVANEQNTENKVPLLTKIFSHPSNDTKEETVKENGSVDEVNKLEIYF